MNDTITVRPDERFDEAPLAVYLKDRLAGADQPLTVRQFGGGAANLTYLLDYGTHQYVLRRPPLGPIAKSAHDMGRESRVLSVLHNAFPPAPQALLYCTDASVIGSVFFVMQRRRGVVVRKTIPDVFADVPDAPPRMAEALVDTLVDLHAVDYTALGLADLGKPDGFIHRQIEGWYRRWHKAQAPGLAEANARADMETLYQWLLDNQPPSAAPSLVHNDYKLDNVMLSAEDPGHVVAVFDWDMCTLGDPLSDLGALLTYWVTPADPMPLQMMAMMPVDARFPTREALVQRYAERSGRDVSHMAFYHALGLYRLTVILAQIYVRYLKGQTQDRRFAALGQMIPVTVHTALQTRHDIQ